jgi:hypothetical protein
MTIDTVNIFDYKLFVGDVQHHKIPARKATTKEPLIVSPATSDEQIITIHVFGQYQDLSTMLSYYNTFKLLLMDKIIHHFIIVEHGLDFHGVLKDGVKILYTETSMRMDLVIHKTELLISS